MLSRRDFLLAGAFTTAAASWSSGAVAQGGGTDYDVVIIGGGVSGLAAAATLLRLDPDLKVAVFEARDRLGGRVYSVPLKGSARDAELGARYIKHPDGPDWAPLRELGLSTARDGEGRLRLQPGMSALVDALAAASEGFVQLNSAVSEIFWRDGIAGVYYTNRGLESAVTSRRIICTLPAPLLISGTPKFVPALPVEKQALLLELPLEPRLCTSMLLPSESLVVDGDAWEFIDEVAEMTVARVGDAGDWLVEVRYRGPRASALRGQNEDLLLAFARKDLSRALAQPLADAQPLWGMIKDWQADNFSLGAITAPADPGVHAGMATPLADTLFFAGEAAAEPAFAGTVHGAYESGVRAAKEVAVSLRPLPDATEMLDLFVEPG